MWIIISINFFKFRIPGRELETSSESDDTSSNPENGKFDMI